MSLQAHGRGGHERAGTRTGSDRPWLLGAVLVLAFVALAWFGRQAGVVLAPIAFAFFVALAVHPVSSHVQGRVRPRWQWLGPVAAMALVLAVLVAFGAGVWMAGAQVAGQLPRYAERIDERAVRLGSALPFVGDAASGDATTPDGTSRGSASRGGAEASNAGGGTRADRAGAPSDGGNLPGALGSGALGAGGLSDRLVALAGTVLSSLGALAAFLVIVFFLTALMLVEAPRWARKVPLAFGSSRADMEGALGEVADRVRRYLVVRAGIGALTAALYAAWLALFGVPFVLTWTLLTFLLNFVPNFGSLISGLLPVAFAFLALDPGTALAVAAGIVVIEQVMGNYVDPRLQGRALRLSSLAILIGLLFWTWVWGIAGALLATPIAVLALVAGRQWDATRPVAVLLVAEPEGAR